VFPQLMPMLSEHFWISLSSPSKPITGHNSWPSLCHSM
jgi:hypothetical protein